MGCTSGSGQTLLMVIVSSKTLVLCRVCALWAVALFLFKNPTVVYANFFVVVLGQAMDMPMVHAGSGDHFAGLVAVLIALLGLEDFVVLFTEDPGEHWRGSVPLRLMGYFGLTMASYLGYKPLRSSVTFTYLFLEMVLNFLLYVVLREELNETTRRFIRQERGQNPDLAEGAL